MAIGFRAATTAESTSTTALTINAQMYATIGNYSSSTDQVRAIV